MNMGIATMTAVPAHQGVILAILAERPSIRLTMGDILRHPSAEAVKLVREDVQFVLRGLVGQDAVRQHPPEDGVPFWSYSLARAVEPELGLSADAGSGKGQEGSGEKGAGEEGDGSRKPEAGSAEAANNETAVSGEARS